MKIRLARLLFVRLIRSRQWGSRNVNKLISHAKADWRYPPRRRIALIFIMWLPNPSDYTGMCAFLLWGTATFRWSHLYQLDVNFINWKKEIWWYLQRQWVLQICIHPITRWQITEKYFFFSWIFTFTENSHFFPFMVSGPEILSEWSSQVCHSHAVTRHMPGPSEPETRVSLTLTLAGAPAPTLTPAPAPAARPAGVASYLAWPPPARHVTASLTGLSSQPAVHPSPLRTTDIG